MTNRRYIPIWYAVGMTVGAMVITSLTLALLFRGNDPLRATMSACLDGKKVMIVMRGLRRGKDKIDVAVDCQPWLLIKADDYIDPPFRAAKKKKK